MKIDDLKKAIRVLVREEVKKAVAEEVKWLEQKGLWEECKKFLNELKALNVNIK